MKVLKKIAAAGLSLCLCMGIAACGNGGEQKRTGPTEHVAYDRRI